MAGTLSEYWKAFRTSTGPRSSWSASRGVQPFPNWVVMSSRRLPGVSRRVSNALAYTIGFQADPGWRVPSPAASYFGSNFRLASFSW